MPGVLPENVVFEAKPTTSTHTTRINDPSDGNRIIERYVLSCSGAGGEAVTVNGEVTIRLPIPAECLPGDQLRVWHFVNIVPRVEDGYLVFETNAI